MGKDIIEKLVPDTSVIIEGLLSKKLEAKEITVHTILIHEAALSELEHQANQNKAIGYLGLDELDKLRELSTKLNFKLEFQGKKPSAAEIKYAKLGEIDSSIRTLAYENDATLLTADTVQARVAKAKGIDHILLEIKKLRKKLKLDSYFDNTTMSVHLRENIPPHAKKGTPGNWKLTPLGQKKLAQDDLKDISREIIEEAGIRKDGFIEIERPGSTIIQLGNYRIVITKPPFSDAWEITAVRPVRRLSLKDYKLSEALTKRVSEQAEGILIAGSPGMGKSTFAQGLIDYYASQARIVKTIEAPRDLVLDDNVTQYAISHGDAQEIHDILLLSRPDNVLFDEMRNTSDFNLFADLRLSGIGLAGVVHATAPIDAIQRFVGRIELGVIPHIIDTVIFIKNGEVNKVLSLDMQVKVPSGMVEADLARPVVVVTDFETKKPEFELYSYGEETVVIPVKGDSKSPSHALAAKTVEKEFRKYSDDLEVEFLSDNKCVVRVPEDKISRIIGKQGSNINQIEKELGISIDIAELKASASSGKGIDFKPNITKKAVELYVGNRYAGKDLNIFINGDFLLRAKASNNGAIKIHKKNKIGNILSDAIEDGEDVKLSL